MKLLLQSQFDELILNGHTYAMLEDFDPKPVVKLFTPDAACTWLLTAIEPDERDIAWGLCDIGLGFAEYGTVSLSELAALRGKLGLPVERDRHFVAKAPISVYIKYSYPAGRIITDLPAFAETVP
ncbi:MAG: DUF2958 domain-containing protein [Hyphomicrobiaceae bacterium]|nr:DUF2958 domain-containing protein [Hyphomicrobiaceae bacterium]